MSVVRAGGGWPAPAAIVPWQPEAPAAPGARHAGRPLNCSASDQAGGDVPLGPVIAVQDRREECLADYFALTDVARRGRIEPERGLFIAEGDLVIRRAIAAGLRIRSLLLAPARLAALAADLVCCPAPVYVAGPQLLAAITGFSVHRGALAAVDRPAERSAGELLAAARRVLVLEAMNNPTNVGGVFRSAAALGIDAVLLDPLCYDPLYRRAVRVSMGAVLTVPYARLTSWPAALGELRSAGFRLWALSPAATGRPLPDLDVGPDARVALLLGAEGPGLSAGALDAADEQVRIPMAAGVDSLNAAAAAAIVCYVVGGAAAP